jgi:hypothetical protein
MSKCQRCESEKVLYLDGKCSDLCNANFKGVERLDSPPSIEDICGGDYITIAICLKCGQVQGEFPKENPEFYEKVMDEREDDFYLCEDCQRSYPASQLINGLCERCR